MSSKLFRPRSYYNEDFSTPRGGWMTNYLVLSTALLFLLSHDLRSYSAADDGDDVPGPLTNGYVTFASRRIANHSYVDVTGMLIEKTSVVCHSPLHTCCSSAQGPDRATWFDPLDRQLVFSAFVHQRRVPQAVELRCDRSDECQISGLYRCEVPVRGSYQRRVKQNIFVGLYTLNSDEKAGALSIVGSILSSSGNSRGDPPFTFTCISTGGPATTVTWTRDSTVLSTTSSSISSTSVLLDQATARYSHVLTLGDRPENGLYMCTVSNDKPSKASSSLQLTSAPPTPSIASVTQKGRGTATLEEKKEEKEEGKEEEEIKINPRGWSQWWAWLLIGVAIVVTWRVVRRTLRGRASLL